MTTPPPTPAINAISAAGWRMEATPLMTGGSFALVCTPDGAWGGSPCAGTSLADLDAAYLRAARIAAERAGETPEWLTALTSLPVPLLLPPPAAPRVAVLPAGYMEARVSLLRERCVLAGWDEAQAHKLVAYLMSEFATSNEESTL